MTQSGGSWATVSYRCWQRRGGVLGRTSGPRGLRVGLSAAEQADDRRRWCWHFPPQTCRRPGRQLTPRSWCRPKARQRAAVARQKAAARGPNNANGIQIPSAPPRLGPADGRPRRRAGNPYSPEDPPRPDSGSNGSRRVCGLVPDADADRAAADADGDHHIGDVEDEERPDHPVEMEESATAP